MVFAVLLAAALFPAAPPTPDAPTALAREIRSLRAISRTAGEAIWPGYGAAPFGLLLITDKREFLLCENRVPDGFTVGPIDPPTGCSSALRPRSGLPDNLLAAMPVFGPPSTLLMGTPAATGYTPVEWSRTILHEHFHQWQAALPGYYSRVNALGLSGGDTTGMWMLNFPFPYASPAAGSTYAAASRALRHALQLRGQPGFLKAYDRYQAKRAAFKAAVGAKAWRYLEFQLWQEGVARWTELAISRRSGDAELKAEADRVELRLLDRLASPDLKAQGRELAYAYGAGEALLMDACGPAWRTGYRQTAKLGALLRTARALCGSR